MARVPNDPNGHGRLFGTALKTRSPPSCGYPSIFEGEQSYPSDFEGVIFDRKTQRFRPSTTISGYERARRGPQTWLPPASAAPRASCERAPMPLQNRHSNFSPSFLGNSAHRGRPKRQTVIARGFRTTRKRTTASWKPRDKNFGTTPEGNRFWAPISAKGVDSGTGGWTTNTHGIGG